MACVTDLNNESLVEFAAEEHGFKELLSEVMKMNYGAFQNYVIAWTEDQKACLNWCISSADYARMLRNLEFEY